MGTTIQDETRRTAAAFPKLGAWVEFAAQSHARACLILALAVLCAILPGFFTIPPTDRDEARFAQATKQMLETGDYVDIRFQDDVRYKKPVGIYWLQAGAVLGAQVLGVPQATTTIWIYRLPSLLGAVAAVLLTYWTALAMMSRRAACLAGLMLASSILVGGHLVDVSPLSTIGALCVAGAGAGEDRRRLFNQVLAWGLSMAVAGAVLCYVTFGMLG